MELPLARFLERQESLALDFSAVSDLVEIEPITRAPVQRYLVRLGTRGLIKTAAGTIEHHQGCTFAVWFPEDYLRRISPFETVQWIAPQNAFHPNIGPGPGGAAYICLGGVFPGSPLLTIIEQVHEIFSWMNRLPHEKEAMNREACPWARAHGADLPIDSRPLLRSATAVDLSDLVLEEDTSS